MTADGSAVALPVNATPFYDASDNPTGCCPRFNAEGWDGVKLSFRKKPVVRAKTRSFAHVPLNMGKVFSRVQRAIGEAGAARPENFLVLSRDRSAFTGEHLFAVDRDVPGEEMATLSGDFLTKVFEGPYKNGGKWAREMMAYVKSKAKQIQKMYFFYTTCPKCAEYYGKNYTVILAQI